MRAPGYFYLLPPQLQRSPFSAVAHASSAQGINENSGRGGRAPARGAGGGEPRRTPGTQGEGQIQLGLPGWGVSLGFCSSQLLEKGRNSDLGQRAPVEASRQRDNRLVFFQELPVFGMSQD